MEGTLASTLGRIGARVQHRSVHPALLASGASLVPFLIAGLGCGPEVSLASHGADAEVYVRALCEDRLDKYVECAGYVPESHQGFSVEECIEAQTADFDDPCFAENDEFFRCRDDRLSCEEYFDINIQTSPGSACYELFILVGDCLGRHPERGGVWVDD